MVAVDLESEEVAERDLELGEEAEMGWGPMVVGKMGLEEKRNLQLKIYYLIEICLKFWLLDWF